MSLTVQWLLTARMSEYSSNLIFWLRWLHLLTEGHWISFSIAILHCSHSLATFYWSPCPSLTLLMYSLASAIPEATSATAVQNLHVYSKYGRRQCLLSSFAHLSPTHALSIILHRLCSSESFYRKVRWLEHTIYLIVSYYEVLRQNTTWIIINL